MIQKFTRLLFTIDFRVKRGMEYLHQIVVVMQLTWQRVIGIMRHMLS